MDVGLHLCWFALMLVCIDDWFALMLVCIDGGLHWCWFALMMACNYNLFVFMLVCINDWFTILRKNIKIYFRLYLWSFKIQKTV